MSVIAEKALRAQPLGTKDLKVGGEPMKFRPENDPMPRTSVFTEGEAAVPDEFRLLARGIFGETEENMEGFVGELREAIREEGLLIPENPHLYRQLLRAGNLEVGGAVAVLRKFLRMIGGSHPHYFEHVLPFARSDPAWEQRLLSTPPLRDQHGRRLVFMRTGAWNPDKAGFRQLVSLTYKVLSIIALEPKTQIAGVTVVVDCAGFGYHQFKNLSVDDLRIVSMFAQQGFPLWFRKVHICRAPRFFQMFFAILKPFLNEEFKNNIKFHDSLNELHKEVPREILPEEYGGDTGKMDHTHVKEAIELFEDYFKEVKQLGEENRGR